MVNVHKDALQYLAFRRKETELAYTAAKNNLLERFLTKKERKAISDLDQRLTKRRSEVFRFIQQAFGEHGVYAFPKKFPNATLADKLNILHAYLENKSLKGFDVQGILVSLDRYLEKNALDIGLKDPEEAKLFLHLLNQMHILYWMERQIVTSGEAEKFAETFDWIVLWRDHLLQSGSLRRILTEMVKERVGKTAVLNNLGEAMQAVSAHPSRPPLSIYRTGLDVLLALGGNVALLFRLLLTLYSGISKFALKKARKLAEAILPSSLAGMLEKAGYYLSFIGAALIVPSPFKEIFFWGGCLHLFGILDNRFAYSYFPAFPFRSREEFTISMRNKGEKINLETGKSKTLDDLAIQCYYYMVFIAPLMFCGISTLGVALSCAYLGMSSIAMMYVEGLAMVGIAAFVIAPFALCMTLTVPVMVWSAGALLKAVREISSGGWYEQLRKWAQSPSRNPSHSDNHNRDEKAQPSASPMETVPPSNHAAEPTAYRADFKQGGSSSASFFIGESPEGDKDKEKKAFKEKRSP